MLKKYLMTTLIVTAKLYLTNSFSVHKLLNNKFNRKWFFILNYQNLGLVNSIYL